MATVRVGGLEMSYRTVGEGPVLLLVAGTGYPGGTWWPGLVDRLAQHRTVLVYDHRGTGATTGEAGEFSTRTLTEDALGLLAALGIDRADVVGHSMGGRVAQWMAIDGGARVRDLVLAASGPGTRSGAAQVHGVPIPTVVGLVELGYEGYLRELQRTTFFTPEFCDADPERVRWLGDAFWADRPRLPEYLQHVVARQQHTTVDRLHEITQRTLVLVGDRDTHIGGTGSHFAQSEYLAATLPDAELVVLPGVSHGYFWQAPDEAAEAIEGWLGRA